MTGFCWHCHADHLSDDQSCSEAKAERIAALLAAARAEVQAIEKCSHGTPRTHCSEHRKTADV